MIFNLRRSQIPRRWGHQREAESINLGMKALEKVAGKIFEDLFGVRYLEILKSFESNTLEQVLFFYLIRHATTQQKSSLKMK